MANGFHFPLFVDLHGKTVVVVGGGAIACRRIRALGEFGAHVVVIAPRWDEPLAGMTHLARPYAPGDLAGAFLAVAATDDRQVNRAVGEEARALGIPVSVADRREECTFFFPALCTGAGLVAGVVSAGADHKQTARGAKAIREVLTQMEESHADDPNRDQGE